MDYINDYLACYWMCLHWERRKHNSGYSVCCGSKHIVCHDSLLWFVSVSSTNEKRQSSEVLNAFHEYPISEHVAFSSVLSMSGP